MERELVGIKEIWQRDLQTFQILWTDGLEHLFNVVDLRKKCPCAQCVDEVTGERKPQPLDEKKIQVKLVRSVGRYALNIEYENHSTGIYTFNFLREFQAKYSSN